MDILNDLKGKIVVSSQAMPNEPLYNEECMLAMMRSVMNGGAEVLRVAGARDVRNAKKLGAVVIGLTKPEKLPDNWKEVVYITPNLQDVEDLIHAGADIIAFDGTLRPHDNCTVQEIIETIHKANKLAMADISTLDEGIYCAKLGADIISTTLAGYTRESGEASDTPDYDLLNKLVQNINKPVILEGRIWEPSDVEKAFQLGAHCVVIGSAITRPQLITKRFIETADKKGNISQQDQKALTFDIGGTKIYSTIVNQDGIVVGEIDKFSTPKTIEGIKEILRTQISKYENKVDVVAIATAGAVNNENTAVIGSTGNLVEGYYTIDFQSLSNKRVFLENDANAAAWAEYKIGASKGADVSVMLTLGTGVGGGIIINNKLLKGKSGAAGEMHFKMYSDKRRKCTCGSWDCFEAYASGTALKWDAQEILGTDEVTTYDVIEGIKNNNSKMIEVFEHWQNDITNGIIGLANIFDPNCVVLSGSMAQFVDIKKIEKEVNKEIVTTPTSIKIAEAGNYAGMIGAALLALDEVR